MPVTRQQIQAEEARTGIKQIAMRREYNAQKMKSSEEVFTAVPKPLEGGKKKKQPSNYALFVKKAYKNPRKYGLQSLKGEMTKAERRKRFKSNAKKISQAYKALNKDYHGLSRKQLKQSKRDREWALTGRWIPHKVGDRTTYVNSITNQEVWDVDPSSRWKK